MSDTDPFPRERVAATIRRMPRYLKLSWRLGRDPLVGRVRRMAVVAAAGYLVSPVDAIPGVIPVLGQLDDIAVALAALRFAMAGLDPARRREHLDAVDLEDGDLAEDLRVVGAATAWTLRAGVRSTGPRHPGERAPCGHGRAGSRAPARLRQRGEARRKGVRAGIARAPRPARWRRDPRDHEDAGAGI